MQPVDIRQQHKSLGPDQVRDECGEPIVVADPDLVRRHGVVLVDHRQHAEPEQPLQGPLCVAVVRAADHVVCREQHLPDGLAMPAERCTVCLREQQLAHGGGGLLSGEVARPSGQPERREPGGNRSGRHQHDLAARCSPGGQRIDERIQPLEVKAPREARQRRRADLHDDAPRRAELSPRGGVSAHGNRLTHRPARRPLREPDREQLVVAAVAATLDPRGQPVRRPRARRLLQPTVRAAPDSTAAIPAGVLGSQSKVTSPIVTSEPGRAPASANASSTPRRARRSAR